MFNYFCSFLLVFTSFNAFNQTITLEDIWVNGKFRSDYFSSFNWTADGRQYSEMKINPANGLPTVQVHSILDGSTKTLTALWSDTLSLKIKVEEYILSPDQTKILFATEEEAIYRRSSKAYYYIFDVKTGALRSLRTTSKGKISYPTFSPDGSKIAFVCENNLFVTEVSSLEEKSITSDGVVNAIINGSCDWVYEEEFEFAKAFFWSPDSKKIAFYRFDERRVKEYTMQLWGETYPADYRYKYPKVGEENASVKILCVELMGNKIVEIDATISDECAYFPRLRWTGNTDVLSYYRMNRLQNKLEIVHYDVTKKTASIPYQETDKAYIEINDSHFYLPNTEDFVFTSEKSGFRHIYTYSKATNSIRSLTQGDYEITEILGVDDKNKVVYFISQETSPLEKQLYSIALSAKKKKRITQEKGVHDISFSPQFDYYTDAYSSANSPQTVSLKATSTGQTVRMLIENKKLTAKLEEIKAGKVHFFTFTTSQHTQLNAWILKPVDFDESKKYPVLLTVYGGPGSQQVLDGWLGANYFWYQLLAQKGYLVVCVDGRGTGGRGVAFKKVTQFKLGKYETEDLVETARYLQTQKYIDSSRIGIFGWSFGGYLSSLAITKGADYFKTAIAVAPVTNWRYYDNIYTERYMGLPQENSKGYDENAPAYFAHLLKGNYLLIHGTADDNVHVQNSLEMQRALINANKQFDVFYYPDKNHSIYGGITRFHLYKMMTDFILKKL